MSVNEEFFNDEKPSGITESVRTFDAFPKTRQTYRISSSRGGALTVLVLTICAYLTWWELLYYLDGRTTQSFTVEKSVGHSMQINLDITIAMPCDTLHINVQDAALDRILAGDILTKETTSFDDTSAHRLVEIAGRDPSVYEILRKARKSTFGKSSRRPLSFIRRQDRGSCRVYGSMDVNRVQGDFHITAKGHGYHHLGEHIDHSKFNFSHVVNELSFGELYPKLVNPLDGVSAHTDLNFYKFQYYLSIVPTFYHSATSGRSLMTNQYAVTEQSREVSKYAVPGIFFKFDIEPLSLNVEERRQSFWSFLLRVVNVIGGVLVSGNWVYKLGSTGVAFVKRRTRRDMDGMLNGRPAGRDD